MKKQYIVLALSALMLCFNSCNKDNEQEINPQYVNLGLSVKWATFNLGASYPEEYGDYYSWGETTTKNHYYWNTYKYNVGEVADSITKYNDIDGLTALDVSDDIAKIKWGGNWRIPSKDEFQELLDSCTWEWKDVNGIKGYKVTSNVSGFTDKSIFLPAAGYFGGSIVFNSSPTGNYWASSVNTGSPDAAYCFIFYSDSYYVSCSGRYVGRSIRPVCQ